MLGKSVSFDGHTHSEYALSAHTHDDRYYTESEINNKLLSKANTSELNSLKTSVSNGKSAVASEITDKGVSSSATASFDTMANNIRSISTGYSKIKDSSLKSGGSPFAFSGTPDLDSVTLSDGTITAIISGKSRQGYSFTLTVTIELS